MNFAVRADYLLHKVTLTEKNHCWLGLGVMRAPRHLQEGQRPGTQLTVVEARQVATMQCQIGYDGPESKFYPEFRSPAKAAAVTDECPALYVGI
jgi:hypothetical protein